MTHNDVILGLYPVTHCARIHWKEAQERLDRVHYKTFITDDFVEIIDFWKEIIQDSDKYAQEIIYMRKVVAQDWPWEDSDDTDHVLPMQTRQKDGVW
jgi:hypothetical protein